MASSRKKVILRTTEDAVFTGYLQSSGFARDGKIELLDLTGRVVTVALAETRMVAYVRDFNLGQDDPEQLTRRTFLTRPRSEGLWVRLVLENGEELEGLAAIDLSLLDGAMEDFGLFLTPPDVRCNTQRVFIPRTSIRMLQVVAVVTSPSKGKVATKAIAEPGQFTKLPFPD